MLVTENPVRYLYYQHKPLKKGKLAQESSVAWHHSAFLLGWKSKYLKIFTHTHTKKKATLQSFTWKRLNH